MQEQLRQRFGFDRLIALRALLLTVAGYLGVWTRIEPSGTPASVAPWSDAGALAAWLVLSFVLVLTARARLARGRRWADALPVGYIGTLIGCVVFGAAAIIDTYWQLAFGPRPGLDVLLRPTHVAEVVAGGAIVALCIWPASC